MCVRLLGKDFFHWEIFYKCEIEVSFCHLCRLGTYRFLYTHRRHNAINNRGKTLPFHCLSRRYNRAPRCQPRGTQLINLIQTHSGKERNSNFLIFTICESYKPVEVLLKDTITRATKPCQNSI